MRRLLRWYGANPLHLLALLGCFALAGYAAAQLVPSRPLGVAVWFLGAVVVHDLLLVPLYSLADRSATAAIRHRAPPLPAIGWINYLRVPAALSALLLLTARRPASPSGRQPAPPGAVGPGGDTGHSAAGSPGSGCPADTKQPPRKAEPD